MRLNLLVVSVLCIHCVHSFGFKVHYIIGQMIQERINYTVFDRIDSCDYINTHFNDSMAYASTWADKAKYSKPFAWTRTLHYYDVDNNPPNFCGMLVYPDPHMKDNKTMFSYLEFILDKLDKGNRGTKDACAIKPYEFKLLLHLLQDLHQPLHLTGKERGGNEVPVDLDRGDGHYKTYKLHAIWDSILYYIIQDAFNLHSLDAQIQFFNSILDKETYTCPSRDEIDVGLLVRWGNEISKLNCMIAWKYHEIDYVHKSTRIFIDLIVKTIQRVTCLLEAMF